MGLLYTIRNFLLSPIFLLAILKGVLLLMTAVILKGPSSLLHQKKRDTRPDCLNDPQLGTHKFIEINGLRLHVVESGDPKNPLMLFIHGFPECWYSWRHQIREFNKQYHCVAFDMRGTGESDAPPGIANYTIDKLTGDVCELIRAVGHKSCILVGHDWGGIVTWVFAARYPKMVDIHIPMNIPHPDRYAELTMFYLPQIWRSWYMFFFQLPWLPEIFLTVGDFAMIEDYWKVGPWTQQDIEAYKFSMSRPGRVTTFVNYYRNIFDVWFAGTGQVTVPTFLIWGTNDFALHVKLSYDTEKFCPNLTVKRIGGDHFIQQDKACLVNDLMQNYLQK